MSMETNMDMDMDMDIRKKEKKVIHAPVATLPCLLAT